MWGYIIGGATIFALIVGLFSIYNGRATRRLIMEEEKRTQGLMAESEERMRGLLERAQATSERAQETSERGLEILERHGKMLEKLSQQHDTMIEILKSAQK